MNTKVNVEIKVHCPICGHDYIMHYMPRTVNDTLMEAVDSVLMNASTGAKMTHGVGHCDVCDLMVNGVDEKDEEELVKRIQDMLKEHNHFYIVKSLKDAYELMVDFDMPDSGEYEMSHMIRMILGEAFTEICHKKALQPHPSAGCSSGGV